MKKIIKKLMFLSCSAALVLSCRDDDKDLFTQFDEPNGAIVTWTEIKSSLIDASNIQSSAYEATIDDPSEPNRVTKYEAFVVYKGDTALYESITSFPNSLRITAARAAQALTAAGFPTDVDDFSAGDRIDVFAKITDVDGVVFEPKDYQNNLRTGPGQRALVQFNIFIACPYVASSFAGTYFVTNDAWNDYPDDGTSPVQVVTDGANAIIIKGLYSNAYIGVPTHQNYDVRVTINTSNGVAAVAAQQAYNTAWWGGTFGVASVDGSGFVLSCTETIILNLEHRVAAGTFGGGPYNITLKKNP